MADIHKETLKIAMISRMFHPVIGGAEKQCQRLAEELINKGHHVFVLTVRADNWPKKAEIKGIPVFRVFGQWRLRRLLTFMKKRAKRVWRYSNPLHGESVDKMENKARNGSKQNDRRLRPFYNAIYKLIWRPLYYTVSWSSMLGMLWLLWRKRDEYDIIHVWQATWPAFIGVWAAEMLNKKVIVRKTVEYNDWRGLEAEIFGSQMIKYMLKNADCFVCISRNIKHFLESYQDKRPFFLAEIPNGVNIDKNCDKLTPQRKHVLFVGRLEVQKGVDILLTAWSLVESRDIKLLIVGDGPERNYLEQMTADLNIQNQVEFAGIQKDVTEHYKLARLFVLPSRWEGMPNVLLEAMAFGLPCVATRVSGSRDLIENHVNGILVKQEDPSQLAQAIDYMIEHSKDAEQMGKEARERIKERYAMEVIADQHIKLYRKILSR